MLASMVWVYHLPDILKDQYGKVAVSEETIGHMQQQLATGLLHFPRR